MAKSSSDRARAYRYRKIVASRRIDHNQQISKADLESLRHVASRSEQRLDLIESSLQSLRHEIAHLIDLIESSVRHEASREKPQPQPKRAQPKLDLPAPAWRPDRRHYEIALQLGHAPEWVDDQAEQYEDWLANKHGNHKHTNLDAGFRNWLKTQDARPAANGNGAAYKYKSTPVNNIWKGFALALAERDAADR